MRNRIIHDYNNVNLDIVWKTVTEVIPELIAELGKILPPFYRREGPGQSLTHASYLDFPPPLHYNFEAA